MIRYWTCRCYNRAGFEGKWDNQDQCIDPPGMANRNLHGRGSSRRETEHRRLSDSECVEQADVRISLCFGRCVCRHRCAQVAKTRHCNHADATLHKRPSPGHTLVMTAAPMNHQQWNAVACLLKFNRSASGGYQTAALSREGGRNSYVSCVAPVDQYSDRQSNQQAGSQGNRLGLSTKRVGSGKSGFQQIASKQS